MKFISKSPDDTTLFAKRMTQYLKPGDILCLFGDLGSGKTTFVKGLAQGLRVDPHKVNSPTFVLMNVYEGKLPIYHFDLYRLEDTAEIAAIGYEEFLYGNGVAVVEWADRLGNLLPRDYCRIELQHRDETQRLIRLSGQGQRFKELVKHMVADKFLSFPHVSSGNP